MIKACTESSARAHRSLGLSSVALRHGQSRGCRSPAGELRPQSGAPESGELACLLGESRGDAVLPEFAENLVGDGGGAEEIRNSLVAPGKRGLREMKEEREVI